MIRTLIILLALFVIAEAQTTCKPPEQTPLGATLRLRVYNVAYIPEKALNRALEVTGSIFAKANVTICWELGSTDAIEAHFTDQTGDAPGQHLKADDRSYLAVKILRGAPRNAFPEALGFALPFAHGGPHAIVFYDRIEDMLSGDGISITEVLGHVIAHEAGHALLETIEHSVAGLMKSHWDKVDFRLAAVGHLKFTPAETRILQEHARRRSAVAHGVKEGVSTFTGGRPPSATSMGIAPRGMAIVHPETRSYPLKNLLSLHD